MKALIDLDALLFMTASVLERVTYEIVTEKGEVVGEELLVSDAKAFIRDEEDDTLEIRAKQNPQGNLKSYIRQGFAMIDNVIEESGADEWRGYSEEIGSRGFRFDVAYTEEYKGKRGDPLYPRPVLLAPLKQWFEENKRVIVSSKWETDDTLCMVQTRALREGRKTIICHNDKDILQCEGAHFRMHHAHRDIHHVKGYGHLELQGKKQDKVFGTGMMFFLYQVLAGDSSDCYSGLRGFGPKTAYKLLAETENYEQGLEAVIEAYKKKDGEEWEKHLIEQGILAKMLTKPLKKDHSNLWNLDWRPEYVLA